MSFLLDTHALLWWTHQPHFLSGAVRDLLESDSDIAASAVSAMEIATKVRHGRLGFDSLLASDFVGQMEREGFATLPVTPAHAQLAGSLPQPHADPWDRLLAAQARIEGLELVSCDRKIADFNVPLFW